MIPPQLLVACGLLLLLRVFVGNADLPNELLQLGHFRSELSRKNPVLRDTLHLKIV